MNTAAVAGRYSFETWEEYVESRWDMDVRTAQRKMAAAFGADEMRQLCRVLPAAENQMAALLRLENEQERAAAWQAVTA